jgi:hypothetical protein
MEMKIIELLRGCVVEESATKEITPINPRAALRVPRSAADYPRRRKVPVLVDNAGRRRSAKHYGAGSSIFHANRGR